MIHALLVILACQLFGEAASHWLALPIPGPVVGYDRHGDAACNFCPPPPQSCGLWHKAFWAICRFCSCLRGWGWSATLALLAIKGLAIALAIAGSTIAAIGGGGH